LQKRPSVHGAVLFGWPQAPAPSHWSSVQPLPSSVQLTPAVSKLSAGHVELAPSQTSATSHSPAAGRQTSSAARNAQLLVQQDPGVPFAPPSSHSSSGVVTTLSPQTAGFRTPVSADPSEVLPASSMTSAWLRMSPPSASGLLTVVGIVIVQLAPAARDDIVHWSGPPEKPLHVD